MSKRKSDEAYGELRRRIMLAELPPNSLLDEKTLQQSLDCGRTPLREAILRLAQEGLVTSMGRRGYAVAGATPEDLQRGYELRRELECFIAGLAAERRTPQDMDRLDAFLAKIEAEMESCEGNVAWELAIDEEFHSLIARASGNQFAQRYLDSLYGLSVRSLYVSQVPITFVREEFDTYRLLIDAVRRRDSAAARAAMTAHLTVSPIKAIAQKGLRDKARVS
ncbi:GntR family transcriptional regulator [Albidovulum sediminis]|uniref:GntR family transcriptional regulator n=1 Tax=Albidovulum sediminis TaxID=3066345 RepID=A0ABT2NJI2_9RHOB|nr:GntR family transcriptional regulator [Defluviimonas sediminis]MCT8329080.1 GntR family transcriptional regulator [Defluviimonas sediminis]